MTDGDPAATSAASQMAVVMKDDWADGKRWPLLTSI